MGFVDGEQAPLAAVKSSMDLDASQMDINKAIPSGTEVGQVLDVSKVFPVAKRCWQLAIQTLQASSSQARDAHREESRSGTRFNWRSAYKDHYSALMHVRGGSKASTSVGFRANPLKAIRHVDFPRGEEEAATVRRPSSSSQ